MTATTTNDDDDAGRAAADAQAEATSPDTPTRLTYGGHSYTVAKPSPKVLEYLAEWQVNDKNLALVLAVRELLGTAQWDAWCSRHDGDEIVDFFRAINEATSPN